MYRSISKVYRAIPFYKTWVIVIQTRHVYSDLSHELQTLIFSSCPIAPGRHLTCPEWNSCFPSNSVSFSYSYSSFYCGDDGSEHLHIHSIRNLSNSPDSFFSLNLISIYGRHCQLSPYNSFFPFFLLKMTILFCAIIHTNKTTHPTDFLASRGDRVIQYWPVG